MLNDRSASREEEESRYETYSELGHPSDLLIGRTQWEWVKRGVLNACSLQPRSLLDIGCGHGAFLLAARADVPRVGGVELDPAGAAACRNQGLDVIQGSLFETGIPGGPWDIITMWDVLEHLEDPRDALDIVLAELAPGGVLILRGRNACVHAPFKRIYARFRSVAAGFRVPDVSCVHRWGFGPAGYTRLLQNGGLGSIRLYPGLPTPGDRSGSLGPALAAATIKSAVKSLALGLSALTAGKVYPFPSVLISGQMPEDSTAGRPGGRTKH